MTVKMVVPTFGSLLSGCIGSVAHVENRSVLASFCCYGAPVDVDPLTPPGSNGHPGPDGQRLARAFRLAAYITELDGTTIELAVAARHL